MRRNPQEGKRKQKDKTSLLERRRKTSLTLTGLLMEGVGYWFSAYAPNPSFGAFLSSNRNIH
jgi:hypothetical protein